MNNVTEGQKLKLAVTLVENVKWNKLDRDFIQGLINNPLETGRRGTEWLVNGAKVSKIYANFVVDLDADPSIIRDQEVYSHNKGGQVQFNPDMVSLYVDNKQDVGDGYRDGIKALELQKILKKKKTFNANLLDFYLDQPQLIPEEWKGKAVYFWGTIYRLPNGDTTVRYLFWRDENTKWVGDWSHITGNCGFTNLGSDSPAAVWSE